MACVHYWQRNSIFKIFFRISGAAGPTQFGLFPSRIGPFRQGIPGFKREHPNSSSVAPLAGYVKAAVFPTTHISVNSIYGHPYCIDKQCAYGIQFSAFAKNAVKYVEACTSKS